MIGNTINEFISDLYINGGPEKEFIYNDKYYIIQADKHNNEDITSLRLDVYKLMDKEADDFIDTIWFDGNDLKECVEKFEIAPIFDGQTIYEIESQVEVLFG